MMEINHELAVPLEIRVLSTIISKTTARDIQRRLDTHSTGISSRQYTVLATLTDGASTIAEISKLLLSSPPTLVPVVDALERKGLVRRWRDPHDRRRQPLILTPAGEELLKQIPIIAADDEYVKFLQTMGKNKLEQLLGLMREVADGLAEGEVVAAISSLIHQSPD
jgi:DNA-binding MarR family transcriptional regulator